MLDKEEGRQYDTVIEALWLTDGADADGAGHNHLYIHAPQGCCCLIAWLFRILNLCTVCRLALCVIDMTANLLIME
jgi:hypothetical protein